MTSLSVLYAREAAEKEELPGETAAAMGSVGEDTDEGRVNLANVGSRSRGTALEFDRRRDGGSNWSGPVANSGGFKACEKPGKPVVHPAHGARAAR